MKNTILISSFFVIIFSCTQTVGDNKLSPKDKEIIKVESKLNIDGLKVYPRLISNENSSKKLKELLPYTFNYFEDIDLILTVEQNGESIILGNNFFIENPNIKKEALFSQSIQNLMDSIGDRIFIKGDLNKWGRLTVDGDFDANIALISGTWDHLHELMGPKLLFCIPTNDVMYVWKPNNIHAQLNMERQIDLLFKNKNTEGLISKNIYVKHITDKNLGASINIYRNRN